MAGTTDLNISVVMVSWQTGPILFDAISAALAADDVHELVLVNHENPADVEDRLRQIAARESRFTLLETGANLGFAQGSNLGAAAASGGYLLFLNPDALLRPGVARRLAETGSALREPWIVGARILNADGREQRGGRRGHFSLLSVLLGFTGLSRFVSGRDTLHLEGEAVPDGPIHVPTVSGAAMMLSRQGFEQLGGLDERYFLHVEDIDICRRAREAGGEVVFDPRAELVHRGSTSNASVLFVEHHKAQGLMHYFWRFATPFGRATALVWAPVLWAGIMLRALWFAARRNFRLG